MSLKREKSRIVATIAISAVTLMLILTVTMAYAPKPPPPPPKPFPGTLWWRDIPDGFPDWQLVENSPDHFDVDPNILPIELKICDIPHLNGIEILIHVANEDWFKLTDANAYKRIREVGAAGCTEPFDWPIDDFPYYPICTTLVVHYKEIGADDKLGNTIVVSGIIDGDEGPWPPAHIHVIPEFAFGTVMAILSLFSGLGVYSKFRRK